MGNITFTQFSSLMQLVGKKKHQEFDKNSVKDKLLDLTKSKLI